ncbi:MAG: UDP-N-acetylmuramoyl-L-alanyl-D-glutamate--2,6-diaminopimelate ligase [Puniceicoccales bacterium]|jgi:UDP-N-acetylmuramoyl-L-alanyl-D-glutamate--2,6-diaminopimelate ligase|nr:UDP-N-acetylmuramoyl-L-alanyl-D-glutamate--2,6-diaminopimelate ligase [Puniceicoccales bacterium]
MAIDFGNFLNAIGIRERVSGIACDSRRVRAGDLFFVLSGYTYNAIDFIEQAVERGSVAIVVQRQDEAEAKSKLEGLGFPVGVYGVDDVRQTLALAAKYFFPIPHYPLCFAVTGTNGKTTITYLLKHLLDRSTAIIGTVAYDLIHRVLPSTQTTPDPLTFYAMLSDLPENAALALEVSSHALAQRRVYGLEIDVAIFSNLTSDHLDFHGDREQYFLAKRRLFSGENGSRPKLNLFNDDDPFGRRLHGEWGGMGYGLGDRMSDYRGSDVVMTEDGVEFLLWHGGTKYNCSLGMIGRHNVENALAAIGAVHRASGQSLGGIVEKLATFPGVPGRLERVDSGDGPRIFIDFAHTEDGLRRVLESLQKIKRRHLLLVFGCGGDRDRTKRAPMMQVACRLADKVIATADNPRHEKITDIFRDMEKGIPEGCEVIFESDRREAIGEALRRAGTDDMVLIAGKGHEIFQQIGDEKIPFNDRDAVRDFYAH